MISPLHNFMSCYNININQINRYRGELDYGSVLFWEIDAKILGNFIEF